MGKIVMPKNSALLNEIESVLKIYYEADGWLPNEVYKEKLKELIGDDQYSSSYTKKAQITSYFGFTVWEDINDPQSLRKITDSGKKMYEAIQLNDEKKIQDVLMNSLETVKFGRNNFGCPESNSDVEPPALFIRATIDLGYLTYREFAWLLWKLEDLGANYTDSINELKRLRSQGQIQLGEEANKYADCKPIMILVRWGFLTEDETASASNGKHITIDKKVFNRFEARLKNLKIYNIDMDRCTKMNEKMNEKKQIVLNPKQGGDNVIYYGAPGCGKSFKIKKDLENIREENKFRVTFHPEYTNSDFVGQIMPTVTKTTDGSNIVDYSFNAGPFTKALEKALTTNECVYLIIEEINRGNAAAIFGDLFQLLDRQKSKLSDGSNNPNYGRSEYEITNPNIESYLKDKIDLPDDFKIYIPRNMFIRATMNSSDQSVFTLDTAFKRRWYFEQIPNDILKDTDHQYKRYYVPGTNVTWEKFLTIINPAILDYKIKNHTNEDKQLGKYFVGENCLCVEANANIKDEDEGKGNREAAKQFAYKVLEYLWNDVCKIDKDTWFDTSKYRTLEELVNKFVNPDPNDTPLSVFKIDFNK